MAFEAQFLHGKALMVDYTPSGADVAAGQVVVVGDLVLIAHRAISDGTTGALAAGGGVYEVTADAAITSGKKLYWDDAAGKVSESDAAGANKPFGYVGPGSSAAADGDTLHALHVPG